MYIYNSMLFFLICISLCHGYYFASSTLENPVDKFYIGHNQGVGGTKTNLKE